MIICKPKAEGKVDVALIGELNPDIIITDLEGQPKPGREIMADNAKLTLGSSTAICACQMAKLGLNVQLISKVGIDYFGDFCIDYLKKIGVGTSGIKQDSSTITGLTVSLAMENDRALVTFLGAIAEFCYQDIDLKYLQSAKHLHMSSYFLQKSLRKDFATLFQDAKKMGLTTSLDTGWDPTEQWGKDIFAVLENTDIFIPNRDELLCISGETEVSRALKKMAEIVPVVICKMGKDGAVLQQGEVVITLPAFSVKLLDTTGAGDSFNAGFIKAFLAGKDLKDCLYFGNACGALSASAIGGTGGFTSYEEVEAFIQANVNR
jgi:sugar/nucleoside kinase (ribokinase family)